VKVQTVNKWVKGQTKPEPWRWSDIERFFGLTDGYIAERVGVTVVHHSAGSGKSHGIAALTPGDPADRDAVFEALERLQAELDMLREKVTKLEADAAEASRPGHSAD
jgi:hypothetical protein